MLLRRKRRKNTPTSITQTISENILSFPNNYIEGGGGRRRGSGRWRGRGREGGWGSEKMEKQYSEGEVYIKAF